MIPQACCLCLLVRDAPDGAITTLGGYAVCRDHVTVVGATLGGEWTALLTIAGLPASVAQRNPRPPGARGS